MCQKRNSRRFSNKRVDSCLVPLLLSLEFLGVETVASCCGHGKYPMTVIAKKGSKTDFGLEIFTGLIIPRTKRFYKPDNKGFYYIPEVSKDEKQN